MFGSLKEKLKGFISKIKGKEEKREAEIEEAEEKPEAKAVEERPEAKKKEEKVGKKKERKPTSQSKEKQAKKLAPKVGIVKKIKALATGSLELEEKDLEPALEELELSLLEADVALDVVEDIKEAIKEELVGKKIPKAKVEEKVREAIRKVIEKDLHEGKDIVEIAKTSKRKPFVIVFFGINGVGKTSTIAKVAYMLKSAGLKVLVAAGDTFRAAAIEQLEEHAHKVGVDFIKGNYGDHPASVAHNALEKAKSKGYDVVLIDTAGRQEINLNLMKELKKLVKVAEPDLRVYVGESISGNALYEQVKTYKELIGIDGVILTKLDLDPKGGTAISVSKVTGAPILYVTTGQGYGDIERFSKEWLIKRLL